MTQQNKAILLTPPGSAAIAVLRLCGPKVKEFLCSHFSANPSPGKLSHGMLFDSRGTEKIEIDDPIVVLSPDESHADLCLHGGPAIISAALELADLAGFVIQQSKNLPLPEEALEADSELESEMLSWLPAAKTELALRTLLDQPRAWQAADISAHNAAAILADRSLFWLLHPPRVAIIGIPNAGKSTLANQLFAQERSITADIPGTTRDWVGEIANINGLAIILVDTPGIRETQDALENEAIIAGQQQIHGSDLVILVLDAAQPLEDQTILREAWPDAMIAINKIDRPTAWDIAKEAGGRNRIAEERIARAIQISAITGKGVDDLRKKIAARFGVDATNFPQPRWWTHRQKILLQQFIA